MKKIIWLIIYALIALIIPFILLAYLNGWIALISLVVIIFVAYKFQDSPAKIPKIIATKYIAATSSLLPIQRKLLLIVIISGGLFLLTDSISWIKYGNEIYCNKQIYPKCEHSFSSIWNGFDYARENFMIPHPSSFDFFRKELRSPIGFKQEWNWYTDEVFLTGLIFVVSLFFLLISVTMSRVISEKANTTK